MPLAAKQIVSGGSRDLAHVGGFIAGVGRQGWQNGAGAVAHPANGTVAESEVRAARVTAPELIGAAEIVYIFGALPEIVGRSPAGSARVTGDAHRAGIVRINRIGVGGAAAKVRLRI